MAATRASGTEAVGYGTMRENVLGLTAVLADGRVVRTGTRARKSAAGYDLTRLLVGSEGTLAVITEVGLRLAPVPPATAAAVCPFPTVAAAVDCVLELLPGPAPARCELLDEVQMEATRRYAGLDHDPRPTLFLEFHGIAERVEEAARAADGIASRFGGGPFRWATEPAERERLWQARHDGYYASLALRPGSVGYVTDVCVPVSSLAECIDRTRREIDTCGLTAPLYGHVGDGNFHVVVLIDPDDPGELDRGSPPRRADRRSRPRPGGHLQRRARHRPRQGRRPGARVRRRRGGHGRHQGGPRSGGPPQPRQGAAAPGGLCYRRPPRTAPEPSPKARESMKITDVETILINPKLAARNAGQKPRFSGIDTQTIYKVVLDNGVVGWGDTRGHAAMSDDGKAALVGTNPVLHLSADHPTGLHGALYDAVGKSLEVPAWALMGRKHRDRVPVAAWTRPASPEDLAAEVQRSVDEGYMYFKVHTCDYYCVIEQTRAVEDVAPAGFKMHYDFNHNRTSTSVMRLSSTRSRSLGSWACWRTPSCGATSTAGGGSGRRPPCPCSCTCPPSAPAPRSSTAAPTST